MDKDHEAARFSLAARHGAGSSAARKHEAFPVNGGSAEE
jgi:hypothetical protein